VLAPQACLGLLRQTEDSPFSRNPARMHVASDNSISKSSYNGVALKRKEKEGDLPTAALILRSHFFSRTTVTIITEENRERFTMLSILQILFYIL
jgi:hypothetical protein